MPILAKTIICVLSKQKPAALFAAAAEVGGILAGASTTEIEALKSYGKNLGIAFQLVDDALDYGSVNRVLGKNTGEDFREGKVTLPVVLAYRRGDQTGRAFWERAMAAQNGEGSDFEAAFAADFESAVQYLQETDALKDTVARACAFWRTRQRCIGVISAQRHALPTDTIERVLHRACLLNGSPRTSHLRGPCDKRQRFFARRRRAPARSNWPRCRSSLRKPATLSRKATKHAPISGTSLDGRVRQIIALSGYKIAQLAKIAQGWWRRRSCRWRVMAIKSGKDRARRQPNARIDQNNIGRWQILKTRNLCPLFQVIQQGPGARQAGTSAPKSTAMPTRALSETSRSNSRVTAFSKAAASAEPPPSPPATGKFLCRQISVTSGLPICASKARKARMMRLGFIGLALYLSLNAQALNAQASGGRFGKLKPIAAGPQRPPDFQVHGIHPHADR
jgi:hypothetical protein